jgi:hypothetical protein
MLESRTWLDLLAKNTSPTSKEKLGMCFSFDRGSLEISFANLTSHVVERGIHTARIGDPRRG